MYVLRNFNVTIAHICRHRGKDMEVNTLNFDTNMHILVNLSLTFREKWSKQHWLHLRATAAHRTTSAALAIKQTNKKIY